jgi:hypothetical protein
MSGRSSALVSFALLGACGAKAPEADPATVTALAKSMLQRTPAPAGAPKCELHQMVGGATLTSRTLHELAGTPIPTEPMYAEWSNPLELDSPAARTLITATASNTERRRAAAELLAAPFVLRYLVDDIDAPLALGVKSLKQGYLAMRAIRYDMTAKVTCVFVFYVENDEARGQWGMDHADMPTVPKEVSDAMKADLRDQLIKRIANLGVPQPPRRKGVPSKPKG